MSVFSLPSRRGCLLLLGLLGIAVGGLVGEAAAQPVGCWDVVGTQTIVSTSRTVSCLSGRWSPPPPAIVAGSSGLLVVDGATDSDFDGALDGTLGLIKSGAGTLTLSRPNTHGGTLTAASGVSGFEWVGAAATLAAARSMTPTLAVVGGRLAVTTGAALGSGDVLLGTDGTLAFLTGAGTATTIANGIMLDSRPPTMLGGRATIEVADGATVVVDGAVNGLPYSWLGYGYSSIPDDAGQDAGLAKTGTGTLRLTGDNRWGGGTVIEAGTLSVAHVGALGLASDLSGRAYVTVRGGATLELSGEMLQWDYDPALALTLSCGGSVSPCAPATVAVSSTWGSDTTLVLTTGIDGDAGLRKAGDGVLVLAEANTYSGDTVVAEGVLRLDHVDALATTSGIAIENGAILRIGTDDVHLSPAVFKLAGTATIDTGGHDLGVHTGIGDSPSLRGRLVKTGAGALTLTAAATHGGGTAIEAGQLILAVAHALPASGTVTVAAGATLELGGYDQTLGGLVGAAGARVVNSRGSAVTLTVGGDGSDTRFEGTIAEASGAGVVRLVKTGGGRLVLAGANTHAGGTVVRAGTLVVAAEGALGSGGIDMADGTTLAFALGGGSATFSNAILFSGSDDPVIDTGASTIVLTSPISGGGFLTKAGSGTLVLSAINSYTGTTTVAAGTLQVDGSIVASPTTSVLAGATLAGVGQVGALAVLAGGTVAPGNASVPTGVLTVAGDAVLAPGSILAVSVDAAASRPVSLLAVTGAATVDGAIVVATAGATLPAGGSRYAILTAGQGVSGRFAGLVGLGFGGLGSFLVYDAGSVWLQFGPQPGVLAGSVAKLVEDRQGQMMTGRVLTGVLLGVNEQINCSNCVSSFASVGSFSAGIHGRASLDDSLALIGGFGWSTWESGGARVESAPMVAAALRWDPADRGASRPFAEIGLSTTPWMRARYERAVDVGGARQTAVGHADVTSWAVFGRLGWVTRFDPRNEAAVSLDLWTGWQRSGAYSESGAAGTTVGSVGAALDRSSVVKLGGQWTHLWGRSVETQINLGVAASFASKSGLAARFDGYGSFAPDPKETVWVEFGGRVGYRLRKDLIIDAFADGTLGARPVGNTVHGGLGLRLAF